jgi:diketogulonate reductase-like aldo/keto reductase
MIPSVCLKGNIELPLLGLGTYRLQGEECVDVVQKALHLGYRHLDTAHLYKNHTAIGKAISSFPRKELFLTSKMATEQIDRERDDLGVDAACNQALEELGVDYIDLYLLHAPDREKPIQQVLKRMVHLMKQGKIRACGVSNFTLRHLQEFSIEEVAANQIELHPLLFPQELLSYLRKEHIVPIAYRSLGKGELLTHSFIRSLSQKYSKTAAQILLRYLVQQNIPVIPKASKEEHLKENMQIFDFAISPTDMHELACLHANMRFCEGAWSDFNYV